MQCPICSTSEFKLLYIINSTDSVNHILDKKDKLFIPLQNHIKFLWNGDESQVVECNNCSLVYAHPFIAGDAKYYNMAYSENYIYPKWKWEFERTVSELKTLDSKNLKLLEIGAGTGEFLKEIVDKYIIKENIDCTEYSEYGQTIIKKLGINCYSLDIRDELFLRNKTQYDIICMFQILEHLDDLHKFFKTLNLLAKKHCKLFIGVPNNTQRKFYEIHSIFVDLSPMHLTRWNYKSMNYLAEEYGWFIQQNEKEPESRYQNMELFIRYYYGRRMKIGKKIESIKNKYLRKGLRTLTFWFIFFKKINIMPSFFSKDMGTVQWFYLIKK